MILLAAVIMVGLNQLSAQEKFMFSDFTGTLDSKQNSVVANLEAKSTTKRSRIVEVDVDIFNAREIKVNLFDDHTPMLQFQDIGRSGVTLRTWTGNFPEDLGSGSFVINGNRVSGHVVSIHGNFEIFPLGDEGVHVVVEHDENAFRSCGTDAMRIPAAPKEKKEDKGNDNDMGLPDHNNSAQTRSVSGDECFIRVIVGYTSLAQTETSDDFGRTMIEHISLAITESNQGYANSDVDMRMEMAYMYEVDDNETNNACNDVDDLQDTNDGKWDDIHSVRNFYDGDMVCLITGGLYAANEDCNPNGGLCGIAFAFDYTDDTNMFQLSEYDCATGNFTFAHEFGHTQGARHDNDNTGTPFSYARGYNQGTFRTIMAVCCSPTRVNYWSNPDIDFPGCSCAMGTSSRDNSRALDVGDFTVAHHRTTPGTYTTGVNLASDEWLNMQAATLLNSTNDASSGSLLQLKSFTKVILKPGFNAFTGSEGRFYIAPTCAGTSYSLTESDQDIDAAERVPDADGYVPGEDGPSKRSQQTESKNTQAADGGSMMTEDKPRKARAQAEQNADGSEERKPEKKKMD